MKTFIKGVYRGSIFESNNGYVIGLFKIKDTNDEDMKNYINRTVTFTGYFADLNKDDSYYFYGKKIEHPKYGIQYNVLEYEKIMPEDSDGIIEFLSSDLFTGIGYKLAKKIVDTLGEHTLDLILEDKSNLLLVPKLSQKKIDNIYNTLTKYEMSHKTICYLTDLGFNMRDSLNIYNTYLENTISYLEHNIYGIIDEVVNISFLKVDEIAKKLNIEGSDERRIEACIIYIMKELTFNFGDTYLKYDDIKSRVNRYLMLDIADVDFLEYLKVLENDEKIVIEDNKYYLKSMYEAEENISLKLKTLTKRVHFNYQLDDYIKKLEEEINIKYNDLQKEAIKCALNNNISIITGGPGTGKTTIIRAIVTLYKIVHKLDDKQMLDSVTLLAPTGRASKRMCESTNYPAMTIHRFLKWNKELNEFLVNEYNKDKTKFLIIDEVSMIDIELMDNLLKGLTDNIQIILVGDYNQLPSVGPGNVLKDLIESDVIDTIKLDKLYRTDADSYITTLAHEINNNTLDYEFINPKSDYQFLTCSSNSIRQNLKSLAIQIKEKNYDYKRVQFMAPVYKGLNGIDNLNKDLQEIFNPKTIEKNEFNYGDVCFRENDKVLQLVNMPDDNVYNGDIGIIEKIINNPDSNKKVEIYINFDSNVVKYTNTDLVNIKHAYAISIHKSQGSEFELVVLPISYSYNKMLYKKLIYTAITRAKKKLILIGEPSIFSRSITLEENHKRDTTLKEKLKKCIIDN